MIGRKKRKRERERLGTTYHQGSSHDLLPQDGIYFLKLGSTF
jgi:hypothetical protein